MLPMCLSVGFLGPVAMVKPPILILSFFLHRTPPSCLQASNRAEQAQALTWIKSHLEEHSDVCLPKQEVYDDYK